VAASVGAAARLGEGGTTNSGDSGAGIVTEAFLCAAVAGVGGAAVGFGIGSKVALPGGHMPGPGKVETELAQNSQTVHGMCKQLPGGEGKS